jgi:hypothetical protein
LRLIDQPPAAALAGRFRAKRPKTGLVRSGTALALGVGMNRTSLAAGLGLLLSSSLLGCAAQTDSDHLPGDLDDATDGAGGKGDAWDSQNDPRLLSSHLNYRLAEIPKKGKLDKPVWAARYPVKATDVPIWSETYWPTAEGSTNTRWVSRSTKSPLEKYDVAFNKAAGCEQPAIRCGAGAKAAWDTYFACAGPAAKWQSTMFQGGRQMYDGVDSDGDGAVDECADNDGIAGWWGLCHSWTPASILEPEPQHAVTYNGVKFEVSDIKALIITLYDSNEALMLGGRCNAEEFTRGANGERDVPDECMDVNPGALHVILGNFLGLNDQALAMDRTYDSEVWNQPIYGYEVVKQAKITGSKANQCIGDTGTKYNRNPDAKTLYEVKTNVDYIVEGSPSTSPMGMADYTSRDTYHYILELNTDGKIIGGTYCTDSAERHPDFLWAPLSVTVSSAGRNPNLQIAKVKTLIELSRKDEGGTASDGRTFTSAGTASIPDNSTTGATLDVQVRESFTTRGLSVTVDLTHTYVGDLTLSLVRNGTVVKVLRDKTGGSGHDIHETYQLTSSELGTTDSKATWTIKAVDSAAQDVGKIEGVKLTFQE